MLDPTSLQTLRTAPDCTSAYAGDTPTQLISIKILVTEGSLLHVVWNGPESVESVERTAIVAVQCAEKKSRLAIYFTLAHP